MKVRETTNVQENVVLANIKALDLCVCGCMYTHAIHFQWPAIFDKCNFVQNKSI